MGSKTINDLTVKATLATTDEIEIQETAGGTSKKTLMSTIRDYILGYVTSLSAKTVLVSDDEVLINDSEASGASKNATISAVSTYVESQLSSIYPADFTGFKVSNDTDTEHDINITAGRCADSTMSSMINLPAELTKQIDATWAAGDDAGGLDTGTVAVSTWYYVFAILKDSDLSADALFSLSKTAPTMPSGYTYFRRLRGALLTDASADILGFFQKNEQFYFVTRINDVSDDAPGTSRNLAVISVPPDFIGKVGMVLYNTPSDHHFYAFGSPYEADSILSSRTCDGRSYGDSRTVDVYKEFLVDSSSQAFYKSTDGSLSATMRLNTFGFVDNAEL